MRTCQEVPPLLADSFYIFSGTLPHSDLLKVLTLHEKYEIRPGRGLKIQAEVSQSVY